MTQPPTGGPVLLTDADERSTLAAARALVAAGYRVHVTGTRRWTLAGVARGTIAERIGSSALHAPEAYATELAELVHQRGIRLLCPATDASMEAVLAHAKLFPQYLILPMPPAPAVRAAADKIGILALAKGAGLAVPESVVVDRAEAVPALEADLFPAVLKPHRSVVRDGPAGALRKCPVLFVDDEAGCRAALASLPAAAFPVLVQRRIRGPGEGVFLLRWGGRYVARFAHRRLREKPPAGGVSVQRESIFVERDFMAAAERLLDALDWRGVAMIECKRDLATGRPVLMEINGRWWGSLQLAIDAGVDFPALLAACAFDARLPPSAPSYRAGVRSRWFWGDVDHLMIRLLRSRRSLHLDPDAPTRLAVLREFFRWDRDRDRWEIGRPHDRAPFVLETLRRFLPIP